jgi:hypothetical protein
MSAVPRLDTPVTGDRGKPTALPPDVHVGAGRPSGLTSGPVRCSTRDSTPLDPFTLDWEDMQELVAGILRAMGYENCEHLDSDTRQLTPLKRVYWPA